MEFVKASLEDFNATYQTLNIQQQHEVDTIIALEALIGKEDADLESQKTLLNKNEEELHALQKAFNAQIEKLRSLENNKSLSNQKIQHLKELCQNIENSITEASQQIEQFKKSTIDADQKLLTEEDTLLQLKQKSEELVSNLNQARSVYDSQKSEVDKFRTIHQQIQISQFDAEKKVAVSENSIHNIQNSIKQNEDEINKRKLEIENQNQQKEKTTESIQTKKTQLDDLIKIQEEATSKLLHSQSILETLRNSLIDENRKLDSKQNEYNLLKSLVDSLEGYPDSIKYLNKHQQWQHNALLLSEAFTVDEEYRKSIESYLDKYLNYYIVENEIQAIQAIQLLKENKKGKAGFFILSQIKNSNKTSNQNGIQAIDKIQFDEKYANLFHQLLDNVFIVENLEEQYDTDHVYLHKEGNGFKSKLQLYGGSVGLFEGNKIGRTQRLEKLKNEIASLSETCQKLKNEISSTQQQIIGFNKELKDENIKKTREELFKNENSLVQIEHKIETYNNQNLGASERIEKLNEQLNQIKQAIANTQSVHQEIKQQMTIAFDNLQQSQQIFHNAEAQYNRANEEYNKQTVIITRQQSRINEIKQEKSIRTQQIDDLNLKVVQYQKQYTETQKQSLETSEKLKEVEQQLHEELSSKESNEKILNEKDQAFYNFRNTIAERETALHKKRKEKEQNENQLSSIKDKLNDMKLHLSSMRERLYVEFKMDLDEVLKEERKGNETIENLSIEVDKLKKRIENLGEVNPMAVEAYKEMKNRYDFIQEQKKDLTDAKESLLKTIEEVESTANQKFLETFEQVKENFKNVFQALFTEDDMCNMKLVDPDNPAETTIEIYAQPKGKKPSTITQLSGGEKTLTSAAFLFAIYLIKPAPFCVLDEVDAPLDDANVGKFTTMIRKFSDNSQFIIVTHNKQTMASVDVIYGVTMQEAGVSRLVPVDFRSLN
ncbi:MAG: chromosome segregation protein SMC [Bacteroidetes bacterium OLB11]|nr:MAG: chromosome segregation protein SMC [Bacteroidetes bacterium OLB11]